MSTYSSTQASIKNWLKARIPFIAINTRETNRALRLIREVRDDIEVEIYVHNPTKGFLDIKDNRSLSDDRSTAAGLEFANERMAQRQNLTFVFTEVPNLEDESDLSRMFKSSVNLALEKDGSIVVLSNKTIWPDLQCLGMSDTLDLPNEDEAQKIIKDVVQDYKNDIPISWQEKDFQKAGSILAGLMEIQIESILYTRIVTGSLDEEDLDELTKEKDKIFADISGIERIELGNTPKVGGLSELKKWLDKKRILLTADLIERKMRPPRGVLLVGVPGCGKSLSAKTIATEWKLPLYRLDMANIHGMYVGQSESRLKGALEAAENVSPCILWIDEIEKGLSGQGGSSGVTTRLIGHFLFWLQECTKRVFVVSTANDVSMLPPELLRRGRFDELFFIDLPNRDDRREIIQIFITRYLGDGNFSDDIVDRLVDLSDGFAGSDLEASIKEVGELAFLNGIENITDRDLIEHFVNTIPLSKTNPEKIDAIRTWGAQRAIPASGKEIETISGEEKKQGRKVLI